ncbi:unnamed protein product [Pleuronectes platessa]|uniref:Uncharacterized protein n=1 Tax=Pleuronectes platessa TaxID=8262 RepID=A0A9N7VF72_PLEPL|nr:unnamed protein product [Pleuronectes platessa]
MVLITSRLSSSFMSAQGIFAVALKSANKYVFAIWEYVSCGPSDWSGYMPLPGHQGRGASHHSGDSFTATERDGRGQFNFLFEMRREKEVERVVHEPDGRWSSPRLLHILQSQADRV